MGFDAQFSHRLGERGWIGMTLPKRYGGREMSAFARYVVIEDCGTLVNPLIVDGQIIGGVAQGVGQALLEHAAYDEDGQPTAVTQ